MFGLKPTSFLQFLYVFTTDTHQIPIKYLHLCTQFGTAKLQHHQFGRLKWEKSLKPRQVHGLSNVISAGRAPLALTGRHVVVAQNLRCQKKGSMDLVMSSLPIIQLSLSLSLGDMVFGTISKSGFNATKPSPPQIWGGSSF